MSKGQDASLSGGCAVLLLVAAFAAEFPVAFIGVVIVLFFVLKALWEWFNE